LVVSEPFRERLSTNDQRRFSYQDDFETPGISPRSANCRKHRRHRPNLRKKARGRPQILQRLCLREENFGFLASFTRFAVVATYLLAPGCQLLATHLLQILFLPLQSDLLPLT
jgi:hypothetical protein